MNKPIIIASNYKLKVCKQGLGYNLYVYKDDRPVYYYGSIGNVGGVTIYVDDVIYKELISTNFRYNEGHINNKEAVNYEEGLEVIIRVNKFFNTAKMGIPDYFAVFFNELTDLYIFNFNYEQ